MKIVHAEVFTNVPRADDPVSRIKDALDELQAAKAQPGHTVSVGGIAGTYVYIGVRVDMRIYGPVEILQTVNDLLAALTTGHAPRGESS